MNLKGKQILVVGLGRSGVGAALRCHKMGAQVTATDNRPAEAIPDAVAALDGSCRLELGGHDPASFTGADLIVLSPGVPEIPPLRAARAAGVQVIGELELSYRLVQAPVVAITGTNGKSTTTSLIGAMVAASGRPTFTGGNLGAPLVEAVGTPAATADGALVVETSSFQLETVETFHARVALLLNLSEDHLDRYPDYEAYVAAKARIFERQTADDFAVVNGAGGQERCVALARAGAARVLTFQLEPDGEDPTGAWLDGDNMMVRLDDGAALERYPRADLRLAGRHNVENALAALLACRLLGVSPETCARALAAFGGLPHRMELAGERGDVRFYNDSKATNVGSVVGSLTGFERPVVLIAGGKDKGGDYAPLRPLLREVATNLVLIGAASDVMAQALDGVVPLHRCSDLRAAVALAAKLARPGDAVVLSPACSSFDMFDNYEQRGEVFTQAVAALPSP